MSAARVSTTARSVIRPSMASAARRTIVNGQCLRTLTQASSPARLRQSQTSLIPRFQALKATTPRGTRSYASEELVTGGPLGKTGLFELHIANGAKMVPFGGFHMPVQYTDLSVGDSHKWTREKASIFDVSHM